VNRTLIELLDVVDYVCVQMLARTLSCVEFEPMLFKFDIIFGSLFNRMVHWLYEAATVCKRLIAEIQYLDYLAGYIVVTVVSISRLCLETLCIVYVILLLHEHSRPVFKSWTPVFEINDQTVAVDDSSWKWLFVAVVQVDYIVELSW